MRSLLLAALVVVAAAPAGAAGPSIPPPGDPAWRPVTFPSVERPTRWEVVRVDGRPAWHARAACAASGRAVALPDVDLRETPVLRWCWKVETTLPPLDERSREGDDFAARVYVLFPFDPERASLRERLRRSVAGLFGDRALPGAALNFVWSGRAEVGSTWPNPYEPSNRMVVLRGPGDDGWQQERVDLDAMRRRFLPAVPRDPTGLAIMTDSDQSCAEAAAWYAGFRLEAPAAPEDDPGGPSSPESDRGC